MARRGKPATASEAERRGIQSVEVSAIILSALAGAGGAIPLKQLSEIADMPPSKTHRYLSSFIRTGLVRQDTVSGYYDLGPAALELGLAALARHDVIELANTAMKELTEQTGATSILCVWGQQGPTVVRWQRARRQLVTSLGLGSILPVLSSATGQVFLSFLPRTLTEDLVTRELAGNKRAKAGPARITTKAEVTATIDKVREAMVAAVDSSVIPGLRAVSSPILDHQGQASAAITLIGTEDYFLDRAHENARALKAVCTKLSSPDKAA